MQKLVFITNCPPVVINSVLFCFLYVFDINYKNVTATLILLCCLLFLGTRLFSDRLFSEGLVWAGRDDEVRSCLKIPHIFSSVFLSVDVAIETTAVLALSCVIPLCHPLR